MRIERLMVTKLQIKKVKTTFLFGLKNGYKCGIFVLIPDYQNIECIVRTIDIIGINLNKIL